jgi:hypothetical protein
MARILVLTHRRDIFDQGGYVLSRYIKYWERDGHRVLVAKGPENLPDADMAILHVDLTVIPETYLEALKRYPVVVNGATGDIRKSTYSRLILGPEDDWNGPVIIKTDLNYGGWPEAQALSVSRQLGVPPDLAATPMSFLNPDLEYPIFQTRQQVPQPTWSIPGLVVERFVPEADPQGYAMRLWVFFGDQESCSRVVSTRPIVKAAGIVERRPVEVPDEIRAERARLGFDFGKFDFVIHDGKPILLDANRTPAAPPPSLEAQLAHLYERMASGLLAILPA